MNSSQPISAIAVFCNELREARIYRRVTIEEVAQATRITKEYIEALETGQWHLIPGAYARGYLASYAEAVGMNRDKVLRAYDYLVSSDSSSKTAILDEAPPLLGTPQYVEVTRSRIQTAWYAALARHHRLFIGLTTVFLLAALAILYISRYPRQGRIHPTPFNLVLNDNTQRIHGPRVVIGHGGDVSEDQAEWTASESVQFVGLRPARLMIESGLDRTRDLSIKPYDTVEVYFEDSLTAKISPSGLGVIATYNSRQVSPYRTKNDTEIYVFPIPDTISHALSPTPADLPE